MGGGVYQVVADKQQGRPSFSPESQSIVAPRRAPGQNPPNFSIREVKLASPGALKLTTKE